MTRLATRLFKVQIVRSAQLHARRRATPDPGGRKRALDGRAHNGHSLAQIAEYFLSVSAARGTMPGA